MINYDHLGIDNYLLQMNAFLLSCICESVFIILVCTGAITIAESTLKDCKMVGCGIEMQRVMAALALVLFLPWLEQGISSSGRQTVTCKLIYWLGIMKSIPITDPWLEQGISSPGRQTVTCKLIYWIGIMKSIPITQ